jgi:ethanolamine utilization cobalamin adenosyltransferase
MNQLLQLGQQGNVTEIENFARQFFVEQGKDYDVEKQRLMSAINQLGR